MKVILIKRGKVMHVGFQIRNMGTVFKVSGCSGVWDEKDKTSIGQDTEVTCIRCLKLLSRCDENGVVVIKHKR